MWAAWGIAHNEYFEDGKPAYEVSIQSVKRLQRYNIREHFKRTHVRTDGRTPKCRLYRAIRKRARQKLVVRPI